MNIRFVSDSSANLLQGEQEELYCVPLQIVVGQNTFVDGPEETVERMLSTLRVHKGKTSTACPGVGDWLESFGDADIVYGAAITSGLSGCWQAGNIAAQEYMQMHPERKVYILDTLSTGPEQELIMEKYRELAEAGLEFEQVCAEIRHYSARTHLRFSLASLENFARNGRVSKAVATAVGILGIRVVGRASGEGTLEPQHKVRGEKKAMEKLAQTVFSDGYRGGKLRISHTQNPEGAKMLEALIRKEYPEADIRIRDNRLLCAYYAETGGVLVGYECN